MRVVLQAVNSDVVVDESVTSEIQRMSWTRRENLPTQLHCQRQQPASIHDRQQSSQSVSLVSQSFTGNWRLVSRGLRYVERNTCRTETAQQFGILSPCCSSFSVLFVFSTWVMSQFSCFACSRTWIFDDKLYSSYSLHGCHWTHLQCQNTEVTRSIHRILWKQGVAL